MSLRRFYGSSCRMLIMSIELFGIRIFSFEKKNLSVRFNGDARASSC